VTQLKADPKVLRLNKLKTKLFVFCENELAMHIISTVNMIELNVVPMLDRPMVDFALSENDQFISVCTHGAWYDIYK